MPIINVRCLRSCASPIALLLAGALAAPAAADSLDGDATGNILVGASEGSVIRGHAGNDVLFGEKIGTVTGVANFRSLGQKPDGTNSVAGHHSDSGFFTPDGFRVIDRTHDAIGEGPATGQWEVTLREIDSPAAIFVSTHKDGTFLEGGTGWPAIAMDGNSVLFTSDGMRGVPGKTARYNDVFVKDLKKGTLKRVSSTKEGVGANAGSYPWHQHYFNGRLAAFATDATNLWPGDNNAQRDVLVKDLASGKLVLVSASASGAIGNGRSDFPQMSPDGTRVAFWSDATNLVPGDTNGRPDIFVKTLKTGAITRVSTDTNGAQVSVGFIFDPAWSPDGKKIAFAATDGMAVGDTNSLYDIFEKNLETGALTRISVLQDGTGFNGSTWGPFYAPDGKRMLFHTLSTNLVAGDTNNASDLYIKDLETGEIGRVSITPDGKQDDRPFDTQRAAFAPNGATILFASGGGEGLTSDGWREAELYLNDLAAGPGSDDRIDGGAGDDRLYGGPGADILIGGDGNDILDGGTGADEMTGGPKNDYYIVDNSGDTVNELIGGGTDTVRTTVSWDMGLYEEHLILAGTANINGKGNKAKNRMVGNSGRNILQGEDGKDYIEGRAGADDLRGGKGSDTLAYAMSDAGVTVNLALNRAQGGHAQGDAIMEFEDILGSGHADDLTGDAKANTIDGGRGNDTIRGGDGKDKLFGGLGNDTLRGEEGDDLIDGGQGQDLIVPGAGRGKLVWRSVLDSPAGGADTVENFDPVNGPTIDLKKIDANSTTAKNDTFTFIGSAAFSNTPGQLRFAANKLQGDVDGNGTADFVIEFPGVASITADRIKL